VREQCAKLPTKQREAVWLRWAEGLDYPAIAQRLDSSTESARANVHHGMKKLRESLLDIWEEEVER
jgi:DNA-directed RNA polymerase specialized sigma24 family protein